MTTFSASSNTGWKAQLNLGFFQENHRTILRDRKHIGPLQIQKPFYPEDDGTCHLYLLHPPGGVVGGDQFEIRINVQSQARALITTPAAGKFYRSAGQDALQSQEIQVGPHGSLEWFPLENIFFSGASVAIKTKIDLSEGSEFIGWDIGCLGRPACGERFTQGRVDQRFEIWIRGKPFRLERLLIQENDGMREAKWGLLGKPVFGNLVCVTSRKDLADRLRDHIKSQGRDELFSVTILNGVILCRYLGHCVEQAKRYLIQAWKILRFELRGKKIVIPRIWNT